MAIEIYGETQFILGKVKSRIGSEHKLLMLFYIQYFTWSFFYVVYLFLVELFHIFNQSFALGSNSQSLGIL